MIKHFVILKYSETAALGAYLYDNNKLEKWVLVGTTHGIAKALMVTQLSMDNKNTMINRLVS